METNFIPSLGFVLRHECVYAPGHENDLDFVVCENVPGDAGGCTKFGIDAADHPGVDIRNLTLEQARDLYRSGEWAHGLCDQLPAGVDTAVFDCAVNCGVAVSAIILQRAILSCGFGVVVDGEIGAATVRGVAAACVNLKQALIGQLLQLRRNRYSDIVLHNAGDARFLKGWLNRVDDLERFLF